MTLLNIPDKYIESESDNKITYNFNLTVFTDRNSLKFSVDNVSTSWISYDDNFLNRISFENLNKCFRKDHLKKEFEIKNTLDCGARYLHDAKYVNAIDCFDEVIFYDENYTEALILKSHALFAQKHFIKALRYYRRAVKANPLLKDNDYHKSLLSESSAERDCLPKIKKFIFTGDEFFKKGDFENALKNYNNALANPSRFKSMILYKLLNKKATALFKLGRFEEALKCFKKSSQINENDYAIFMTGFCLYALDLPLNDDFSRPLRITNSQQLYRAIILNEYEMYDDAIKCTDDLLDNHFMVDKIYLIALSCKISSMQSLGIDASHEIELFDKL